MGVRFGRLTVSTAHCDSEILCSRASQMSSWARGHGQVLGAHDGCRVEPALAAAVDQRVAVGGHAARCLNDRKFRTPPSSQWSSALCCPCSTTAASAASRLVVTFGVHSLCSSFAGTIPGGAAESTNPTTAVAVDDYVACGVRTRTARNATPVLLLLLLLLLLLAL